MGRLLGAVVLSCVLVACTVQTPGTPLRDPATGPSFGAPRDVSAFDPCEALPSEPEQWWMRKAAAPARPGTAVPGSCFHLFGTGGPRDVGVLVGLRDMAYDEEKTEFPDGHLARFGGHPTYLYCGEDDTGAECTAWVALAPRQTLVVSTYQRGTDAAQMLPTVRRYLLYIVERLPRKLMKRVLALVLLLTACGSEQAAPKFIDTDPCTLLQSGDAGELTSTAKGERECTFAFGSTTVTVTLLEAKFDEESARLQAGGGYGAVVEDRPMTRRCASSACEAVVQVREGELLGLTVTKQGEDDNVLGQTTQGLALKALERLPR